MKTSKLSSCNGKAGKKQMQVGEDQKKSNAGARPTYTDEMLAHDLKLYLKHSGKKVQDLSDSQLGRFSTDGKNIKELGTLGINRFVWMRRYSDEITRLKKGIAVVVRDNEGEIISFTSASALVMDHSEVEVLANVQRLLNVCQSLTADAQEYKKLKEVHKEKLGEIKELKIRVHELWQYAIELEKMLGRESLDSLDKNRRKEMGLPNLTDMMNVKKNAKRASSGQFEKEFPILFSNISAIQIAASEEDGEGDE